MNKIILNAHFTKHDSMSDRSEKLIFHTRELNPEEVALLRFHLHNECCLMIKDGAISDEETNELPNKKVEKIKRSNSKLLRSVIYKYWESQGAEATGLDSEQFYNREMFKLIESYKEKL